MRVTRFIQHDHKELLASGYCKVFVVPDPSNPSRIWGYYTLSGNLMPRAELHGSAQKKVPKGLPTPVALIGFMGRDASSPKGLGVTLLMDAARRVKSGPVGHWGLVIQPENAGLAAYYEKVGFRTPKEPNSGLMYANIDAFLANLEAP